MDKQTGDRILTLFNRAREDSDFQRLNEEMRMSNGCVVALIRQLPQRQWDILIDHLGLIYQMSLRMLVIACTEMDHPKKPGIRILSSMSDKNE